MSRDEFETKLEKLVEAYKHFSEAIDDVERVFVVGVTQPYVDFCEGVLLKRFDNTLLSFCIENKLRLREVTDRRKSETDKRWK